MEKSPGDPLNPKKSTNPEELSVLSSDSSSSVVSRFSCSSTIPKSPVLVFFGISNGMDLRRPFLTIWLFSSLLVLQLGSSEPEAMAGKSSMVRGRKNLSILSIKIARKDQGAYMPADQVGGRPGYRAARMIFCYCILFMWTVFCGADELAECKQALQAGKYLVAADLCQSAAASSSDSNLKTEALLAAAEAHRALGKSLSAFRIFNGILTSCDKNNQPAFLGKAETGIQLGDLKAALKAAAKIKDEKKKLELRKLIRFLRFIHKLALKLMEKKKYKAARMLLERLLKHSPEASQFLTGFADCCLYLEQYALAIDILKKEASLAGDSSVSYYTIGKIYLAMGNFANGKKFINGAVRDNPDLRPAMALRSKLKQVESLINEATSKMLITQSLKTLEELKQELSAPIGRNEKYFDDRFPFLLKAAFSHPIDSALCQKYSRKKDPSAPQLCRAAISTSGDENEKKTLSVALVEALLGAQDVDEAVQEMKALQGIYPRDSEIQKLAKRVSEAQKKSKMKDYYAVLGIEKGANEKDIKKAYMRLSKKWHPDKHSSNPAPAEKMMKEINRAYEILGDAEKKSVYDQTGYDPDDPEAQQAAHGGFGGGGFGGFDFSNFDFMFQDGQGRQHRQHGSGGRQQQHHYRTNNQQQYYRQQQQKQQQQQQHNWRWEDL